MKKAIAILVSGMFAAMAVNTYAADSTETPAAKPATEKKHHDKHHEKMHKDKGADAAGTPPPHAEEK